MFTPKTKGVRGDTMKLHGEELHSLLSSSDIRVIKLRRML
jgi:hypothetical protein